ncbi:MAG: hypothetical protein M3Y12_01465, partial [Bacteroidota bacterium]|nr:hypothetical protein [Bacteroidota bacterium]
MHFLPFVNNVRRRLAAGRYAAGLALVLLGAAGPATGPVRAGGLPPSPPSRPPQPAERYWITLRDKAGVRFSPQRYFAPEARARRRRQHLPAFEATDLPVRPDYLAAIAARVDTVTLVSRWFNALSCRATPAQAAALRQLPGVR